MKLLRICAATMGAAALTGGCAHDGYHDRGYGYGGHGYYANDYRRGNGYHGRHRYADRLPNPFRGRGADKLDPWLSGTREGQQFVIDHYALGSNGEIGNAEAESANVFFRRWADTDRDYRLTDAEIRTALVHTRNRYGLRRY